MYCDYWIVYMIVSTKQHPLDSVKVTYGIQSKFWLTALFMSIVVIAMFGSFGKVLFSSALANTSITVGLSTWHSVRLSQWWQSLIAAPWFRYSNVFWSWFPLLPDLVVLPFPPLAAQGPSASARVVYDHPCLHVYTRRYSALSTELCRARLSRHQVMGPHATTRRGETSRNYWSFFL